MKRLTLSRIYLAQSTLGVLQHEKQNVCFTVELPNLGNKREISCIPAGLYRCQKTFAPTLKTCIAIKNVPNRSGVFIHTGNKTSEIRGCILPVMSLNSFESGLNSRFALKLIFDIVGSDEFELLIK